MSRDVKEWPVLGTTLKAQPLAGIVPDLGTSQNCSVVSRDVKERSTGLGAPETRPDLGMSLNCPQKPTAPWQQYSRCFLFCVGLGVYPYARIRTVALCVSS